MTDRYQVRITAGAEEDLRSILGHVAANGSRGAAQALLEKLLDRIDRLERFPQRGAIPKELEPLGLVEFRQIVLPPYRLIYRIDGDHVSILTIADGRRDMQTLLERRLLGSG